MTDTHGHRRDNRCAPDGQHCPRCNGIHNPYPGCTFVTSRRWELDDDEDMTEE